MYYYRKTYNKLTKSIRNAKSAYFRDKIVKNNKLSSHDSGNQSKLFWETNIVPPIYLRISIALI